MGRGHNGRIKTATLVTATMLAAALGAGLVGHPRAARADDGVVTEVGGGGYGVAVKGPSGVNLTPVPNAVIPPEGGQFYGYADDQFLPGVEVGRAVVYAEGNVSGDPVYAFVDSRVAHLNVLGIPALTFGGIKSFCEWDPIGGGNNAFGMTFVYYDGAYDWQNHPEVPLATPVPENTRVDIPGGGYYILNEQFFENDPKSGRQVIVVNGLHAFLPDGTEILAAVSSCDPLRPPLYGFLPSNDTRVAVQPATAGFFDPMNNLVIDEDCYNNVDDNGNDLVDFEDPACQSLPDCGEDGSDLFFGTTLISGDVHNTVEPIVNPTGITAAHTINCAVIVPLEQAIDGHARR